MLFSEPKIPQIVWIALRAPPARRFSALQRAENSSNVYVFPNLAIAAEAVSVLFSEPKIPQKPGAS